MYWKQDSVKLSGPSHHLWHYIIYNVYWTMWPWPLTSKIEEINSNQMQNLICSTCTSVVSIYTLFVLRNDLSKQYHTYNFKIKLFCDLDLWPPKLDQNFKCPCINIYPRSAVTSWTQLILGTNGVMNGIRTDQYMCLTTVQ